VADVLVCKLERNDPGSSLKGQCHKRWFLACTCRWNSPARWTICASVQNRENISSFSFKGTMSQEMVVSMYLKVE
jgi:hypothetical protein